MANRDNTNVNSMTNESSMKLTDGQNEEFNMESRPRIRPKEAVVTKNITLLEAFVLQEWIMVILVLLLVLMPSVLGDKVFLNPRQRFFMSTDATISYPGPNVSSFSTMYFALTYFIIVTIIAFSEFTICRDSGTNLYFAVYSLLYFALDLGLCMAITGTLTVYLKYYVGRLRPDFLSRCDLGTGLLDPTNTFISGTSTDKCLNQNTDVLSEGRLSYPSGHTSIAFCQGFYLLCYMMWALYIRPQDPRRTDRRMERNRFVEQLVEVFRGIALFIGPAFALFVGASRLVDYKHHPSDVNA
eukprot:Ihof_evm3s320 gene=Ihof_evmTU3s320